MPIKRQHRKQKPAPLKRILVEVATLLGEGRWVRCIFSTHQDGQARYSLVGALTTIINKFSTSHNVQDGAFNEVCMALRTSGHISTSICTWEETATLESVNQLLSQTIQTLG